MMKKTYDLNETAEECVEWIMDVCSGSYKEEDVREFITESDRFENSEEIMENFEEVLQEIDNRVEFGYY